MLTIGGTNYTADSSSVFAINGQTLAPGGIITVSETPISLAEDGGIAFVGTSTQSLVPIPISTIGPVLTFNVLAFTADASSAFSIKGQTLTPGGLVTLSNTPIYLATGGTIAIVGTRTQLLTPISASSTEVPILTLNGTTFTTDPTSSAFIIDGQILTKGAAITVNGIILSFDAAGTAAIIGDSTQILSTATITGSEASTITFAGQIYTENGAGEFVIGGKTLTRGGEIVVSGTPVSFAAGGTDVIVGSSTESVGLGAWVMSGFGPRASQTDIVPFEGNGVRSRPEFLKVVVGVGVVLGYWMLAS